MVTFPATATSTGTLKSHLGGYDGNHLCSFPLYLLHHRSAITATSNSCLISFQCDPVCRKVSRALWDLDICGSRGFGGYGGGRKRWDSLEGRGMRLRCRFLCYIIDNDKLLGQFYLTGQTKSLELGLLGERGRGQTSLHWRIQRLHAHLWLRESWLVIWGAAFGQEEVAGSGKDLAEAWQVFGRTEWGLREIQGWEDYSQNNFEIILDTNKLGW